MIKAEYIGGGVTLRELADKHGVSRSMVMRVASAQEWTKAKEKARIKAEAQVERKVADAVSENAAIAERIRSKLLRRIEAEIDSLPQSIGTEMNQDISDYTYEEGKAGRVKRRTDGGKRYKLRDLTGAYKDIMGDMPKGAETVDDPLLAIIKRWDDASAGK